MQRREGVRQAHPAKEKLPFVTMEPRDADLDRPSIQKSVRGGVYQGGSQGGGLRAEGGDPLRRRHKLAPAVDALRDRAQGTPTGAEHSCDSGLAGRRAEPPGPHSSGWPRVPHRLRNQRSDEPPGEHQFSPALRRHGGRPPHL